MSSSETTTGNINCPECSLSFDTRMELERHSREQHMRREGNIKNQENNAENESLTKLPSIQERVISRSEEKGKGKTPPRNFQQPTHACEDCGQTFDSLSDLTMHYKKSHPESM